MDDWRDRTKDFQAFVETLRASGAAISASPSASRTAAVRAPLLQSQPPAGPITRPQTEFAALAARLGRDLAGTSEKLARLTDLAKTRSLFSEQTVAPQVAQLTSEVSEEVRGLTSRLEHLREVAEATAASAPGGGRAQKQYASHAETVVAYLRGRVATATTQFRDVLETRSANMKAQNERKQKFAGNPGTALITSRSMDSPLYQQMRDRGEGEESLRNRHGQPPGYRPLRDLPSTLPGEDVSVALPMPQMAVVQQERYYGARAEAVTQIERYLGEIQTVFTQLASLVQDQGEMLERIDHNVDTSLMDVESAHGVLSEQLHKMRQNRALIFKIFGVLLVFVVVFLIFFL